MVRIALAMLVVALGAGTAAADDDAYACRAGTANVKVTTDPVGRCTGFQASDAAGKPSSDARGLRGSGTLYATPDGRGVVFVQDYPMADDFDGKLEALAVWRDGIPVATAAMSEVMGRLELVEHSTSHVQWVWKAAMGKDALELTTTSMKRVVVGALDGKLSTEDAAEWKQCDAIVYGAVSSERIVRPAVVKGSVTGPVKVAGVKDGPWTVCLKADKVVTTWRLLFNALPQVPARCAVAFLLKTQGGADVTGKVSKLAASGRTTDVTVDKLSFQLASDLPVPFKQGDTIAVHYACGGPGPGVYCDARIEDKAGKVLLVAAMNNTDTLSDGWTSRPGKVLRSDQNPNERRRSLKRTQEVTVSKGSASVSVAPAACEQVTEGGVTWLVSGGAESWDGARPPDAIDTKWYSLWRVP